MVVVPEGKKVFRCACYTRKSTEVEKEYNSLDAQREAAENFIASQKMNGWQLLPEKYDDGGYSGGNIERPALKRLIADIEAGMIDVVVLYKMDRLSRSLLDFMKLAELFEEHGTSIVSITQQINTSTSAGRMMLNILMTFAEFERDLIAERVRDRVAGVKKRGKFCGGTPVLGHDSDPKTKKLIVNKTESELVRKVFKLYCKLGSGLEVARELNCQGERTKSYVTRKGKVRKGVEFRVDHVWRILNNPIYIGQVLHIDKTFTGEHEAIVSRNDWKMAHDLLESNMAATRKSKYAMTYPLKGLIRCGYCGSAMTTTYTKKGNRLYIYLQCVKDKKHSEHSCPLRQIPGEEFEKAVLQQLASVFRSPSMLAETYAAVTVNAAEESEKQLAKRDELTIRLDALREQMFQLADTASDKDLLVNQREQAKIERELKQVKNYLKILSSGELSHADITKAFNSIEELWEELFPAEKHRLIRLCIENIVLFKDHMDIEIKTNGIRSLVLDLQLINSEGEK